MSSSIYGEKILEDRFYIEIVTSFEIFNTNTDFDIKIWFSDKFYLQEVIRPSNIKYSAAVKFGTPDVKFLFNSYKINCNADSFLNQLKNNLEEWAIISHF